MHYPEVDFTVTHLSQKPLVSRILGGWEHARLIEFNTVWDPDRHEADRGMTYHPDCAEGISLQEYSTRVPYGPPDNLLTFMYLTDVDEQLQRLRWSRRAAAPRTFASSRRSSATSIARFLHGSCRYRLYHGCEHHPHAP